MINPAAELAYNRQMTDWFIKSHPSRKQVVFSRQELVTDNAGGWKPGTPTTGLTYEIAMITTAYQLPVRRTVDGQEVMPEYVLVARHDADIERGDWFWIDGIKYEVVFVHPNISYEVKAEVVYRG